jgi:hypothetical protein
VEAILERIAFIFCIEASLKLLTHRYLVGTGRYHYKRLFTDDKGKLGILQALPTVPSCIT